MVRDLEGNKEGKMNRFIIPALVALLVSGPAWGETV